MRLALRAFVFAFAAAILSTSLFAQNIPLQNWSPAPWQQARSARISTNAVSTAFMAMAPCRVYDSRSHSALPGLTSRTIDIDGGPCSGIPPLAIAYSINITVFGSTPSGSYEFVTAYPTGSTRPSVSTLNFQTGSQTSNAATVPTGTSGDIDLYTTYTTHFVIDVNGYYSAEQNPTVGFSSTSEFATAIAGVSTNAYGVMGSSTNSSGVVGGSEFGDGMTSYGGRDGLAAYGSRDGIYASGDRDGVVAYANRDGVYGEGFRTGVVGVSNGSGGTLFGVTGTVAAGGDGSAGVLGRVGNEMLWANTSAQSGVRGDGQGAVGVTGFSDNIGVAGIKANGDGTTVEGYLGMGSYGVFSLGNTGATGTKSFVEPHATDPQKVIKYVSLEGPEAGTYFRGRGALSGGRAVIEVPEDFRMVTDPEGLTVHLTPIGGLAIVALVSADLNKIVVESNKDIEFSYFVYGVRRAFKDFQPIQREEGEFMPKSAESVMPSGLPAETQRRLIDTGVYNPDGTVNLDTAERLGWTKVWRERSRQQNQ